MEAILSRGLLCHFGVVKLGPDTTTFNTSIGANAGYTPDGNDTAFSLTHILGTSGGPVYGVVSQMPLTSLEGVNVLDNLTYMQLRQSHDQASTGYYRSQFRNGVATGLTATGRVGFLQCLPTHGGRDPTLGSQSAKLKLKTFGRMYSAKSQRQISPIARYWKCSTPHFTIRT